jgi:hypothetical protein
MKLLSVASQLLHSVRPESSESPAEIDSLFAQVGRYLTELRNEVLRISPNA